MDILEFENASALDVALVKQVVDLLSEAIEIHEVASLVVSGGRTPQALVFKKSRAGGEGCTLRKS